MTLRHLLLMPMNKILNCKDHQIYSKMLRKICIYVKRKSNISFIVIKSSSFDRFLMVKTFLKIIWWGFLVLYSEHLLVSSATLSCTYDKIFWLCQCKYTMIQMWLFSKFLTYAHFIVGLFQFINNQGFKWN